MNIYEKMAAIMGEVQYLAKDDHVRFKETNYKAMSEEKVTAILREKMLKYGLVVFPESQTASRVGNITHVDVTYRMVNIENPEESITIASCGDGADTQDKGSGKAMTYAFKYMWLRTFAIPTGEDPDKISSDELDANEKLAEDKKEAVDAPTIYSAAEINQFLEMAKVADVNVDAICKKEGVPDIKYLSKQKFVGYVSLMDKTITQKKAGA